MDRWSGVGSNVRCLPRCIYYGVDWRPSIHGDLFSRSKSIDIILGIGGLPMELLYADDLVLVAETEKLLV